MKKIALTVVLVSMLTVTSANSENRVQNNDLLGSVLVKWENSDPDPFCRAILEGDLKTVKRLIALGEDVNKKSLGMTPAMYAARYNKSEILKLLIKRGANLSIKSDKGFTAEKYAQITNADKALAVING